MSIAKAYSAQLNGLNAEIITIEVDIANGLHTFSIVGLGDRAVEEAKDRISAAIKNTGFTSPKQKNQKLVISLAPADIRKEGPVFDLAMTIAYLSAAEEIKSFDPKGKLFLGELSLEGNIRKINGLLPILFQARKLGFKQAYIPKDNFEEASLTKDIEIYPISNLVELVGHFSGKKILKPNKKQKNKNIIDDYIKKNFVDMSSIKGNETVKRGLEIAAAGGHNILMYGPPGTGKTMLAHSFQSILPLLTYKESIEVTGIHSAAKVLKHGRISVPPFRSPHHTASAVAILGGGSTPHPGEITLAHRGVLFLDEFPEFDREVIESLRQPLEDGTITVSRAKGTVTYPAQCILIASMNPCRCGKSEESGCTCPPHVRESYKRRISAAILDRIDLWLNVNKIDYAKLSEKNSLVENSEQIKRRVIKARMKQVKRYSKNLKNSKTLNSELDAEEIEKIITLTDEARDLIRVSALKFKLSGRAFHRVIKVARTIADLDHVEDIERQHILEALQYRQKMA